MSKGMIITEAGLDLLAKALTGKELNFTRGAVGDGTLPEDTDPRTLTGLIAEKKSLVIQSMRASSTGTCEVVFDVNNIGLESGFWLREYGLFAKNPDTEEEILYSYCNKGTHAGYLEGNNGIDIMNFSLTLTTVIDQAENITAIINTANNYVTISRLDAKIEDLYANDSDIAGVYTFGKNTSKRLTPTLWQDFKLELLGLTDINNLRRRVEIMESNFADTLLVMEKESMFPNYTHYVIEDFRKPDTIDQSSIKITDATAGDDSANAESFEGLDAGKEYTLTDGASSEKVRIKALSTENAINRIIFEHPIENTYMLTSAKLARTDAVISGGSASMKQSREYLRWSPNIQWSGFTGGQSYTASLNLSGCTLSGSAVLSLAGSITLKEDD